MWSSWAAPKICPARAPRCSLPRRRSRSATADWGAAELGKRLVQAWQAFSGRASDAAAPWLVVQQHQGPQAVQAAYAQVLAGRGDPRTGHMLSLG
jgi:hypothetical protein